MDLQRGGCYVRSDVRGKEIYVFRRLLSLLPERTFRCHLPPPAFCRQHIGFDSPGGNFYNGKLGDALDPAGDRLRLRLGRAFLL